MNPEIGSLVVQRFFRALDVLISRGIIRGKKTFADLHNINRRNFWKIEKENRIGLFDVAWLSYLVTDYGVSATWLLTGEGSIINTNT